MIELINGPMDGQTVELGDQRPYVLQMIHIWGYAQIDYEPIVEYYLSTDGKYYHFA